MNIGNVTVPPDVKLVITKSSIDRLNASSAAAMTPGRISGKVTLRNVVSSFAPRSIAASSRWVGKPDSRARTVTTTKLMLNMMWAIRIVMKLSGKNGGAPIATNSVSSEAPEDDLGRGHRQEDEQVGAAPAAEVVAGQGQRDERPEDRRDDRRQRRR